MQELPNLLGTAFYNNSGILNYKRNIEKLIMKNIHWLNDKECINEETLKDLRFELDSMQTMHKTVKDNFIIKKSITPFDYNYRMATPKEIKLYEDHKEKINNIEKYEI